MPKISEAQGASHEGVIAEHDGEMASEPRVDVQEPIRPQEDPSLGGQFHAQRNAVESEDKAGHYDELSKDELVAELEQRDLPKSGTKDELRARLEEDDRANDEQGS